MPGSPFHQANNSHQQNRSAVPVPSSSLAKSSHSIYEHKEANGDGSNKVKPMSAAMGMGMGMFRSLPGVMMGPPGGAVIQPPYNPNSDAFVAHQMEEKEKVTSAQNDKEEQEMLKEAEEILLRYYRLRLDQIPQELQERALSYAKKNPIKDQSKESCILNYIGGIAEFIFKTHIDDEESGKLWNHLCLLAPSGFTAVYGTMHDICENQQKICLAHADAYNQVITPINETYEAAVKFQQIALAQLAQLKAISNRQELEQLEKDFYQNLLPLYNQLTKFMKSKVKQQSDALPKFDPREYNRIANVCLDVSGRLKLRGQFILFDETIYQKCNIMIIKWADDMAKYCQMFNEFDDIKEIHEEHCTKTFKIIQESLKLLNIDLHSSANKSSWAPVRAEGNEVPQIVFDCDEKYTNPNAQNLGPNPQTACCVIQ